MWKTDSKDTDTLEAGNHVFEVVEVKEAKSKNGNNMFIVSLGEDKTLKKIDVYLVNEQGKKGNLIAFLFACGLEPDVDGEFEWDEMSVIGQRVQGFVENEAKDWIDSKGVTRKGKLQSKIVQFAKLGA